MAEATVDYAWCVAIRVKYLGPSNTLGSRWRVWRADETYNSDPDRKELGYNHALSGSETACAMVRAYLKDKDSDAWSGRWVLAGADRESYIAIRVPNDG